MYKWGKDILRVQNWHYVKLHDEYICGYGRYLSFIGEKKQRSDNGYESLIRIYECEDCSDCPYREKCVKSAFGNIKGNFAVRRFLLRGLEKVKIEWGLYSIGHNMRKLAIAES
jgi:hypothetical protein